MKTATYVGTVAYADDHDEIRESICSALQRAHFNIVIAAANGKQLLKSLRSLTEPPDACLIDMVMPEMGGMEVIPKIRQSWPNMVIIACSASSITYRIEDLRKIGANHFWLKGNSIQSLIDLITLHSQ